VSRQVRLLGLSMLAVSAVGVVMSASASAHAYFVCKEGGTEKYETSLCAKKQETGKFSFLPVEKAETYKVEGKSSGIIEVENMEPAFLGNPRTGIECKKDKLVGEIGAGESKRDVFTFEECALYLAQSHRRIAQNNCSVPNIPSTDLKSSLITGTGSGPEDEFEPESGTTMFEITLTGGQCVWAGKYSLTGKQSCSLPEGFAGKVEHEIVCSPTGSSLDFQAVPSNGPAKLFMDTTVKLSAGSAWGAE